ncbi:hypothetical protein JTE87_04385 [Bacillus amyloliquefaciens]|nr:hypothetical protein [Bacillus amyloliquefaciens]RHL12324.1 hypothetical protein DW032_18960 [Bacillus licheniformis]
MDHFFIYKEFLSATDRLGIEVNVTEGCVQVVFPPELNEDSVTVTTGKEFIDLVHYILVMDLGVHFSTKND